MKAPTYCLLVLAGMLHAAPADSQAPATAKEGTMTRAEVRHFLKTLQALDPSFRAADKFWHLENTRDDQAEKDDTFKIEDVVAVSRPNDFTTSSAGPQPIKSRRRDPSDMLPGALPAHDVYAYLRLLDEQDKFLRKKSLDRIDALIAKYDQQPWYIAAEVRDVAKNGSKIPDTSSTDYIAPRSDKKWQLVSRGLRHVRVRSDWSDQLAIEDSTQTDNKTPASFGDLVGAKVSYTHAARKDTDSWKIDGAIIMPFTWVTPLDFDRRAPSILSFAPSASIHKFDTNGDPKDEVDYVYYRLGVFSTWHFETKGGTQWSVLARGAPLWATDARHNGNIRGGELDVEFHALWPENEIRPARALGLKNIILPKSPVLEDGSDNSRVEFQLRAWLHAEFGDVQRNGAKWDSVDGGFARIGPTVQAQLNFPTILRGLSFTAKHSNFKRIKGPDIHRNYVKLSSALTLLEYKPAGQKISLTAEYVKGSLILTSEFIETTNVGIGIVY